MPDWLISPARIPVTWAAAIAEPDRVCIAVSEPIQEEIMPTPGANKRIQGPWLEFGAFESLMVVTATTMARDALAGEMLQASVF